MGADILEMEPTMADDQLTVDASQQVETPVPETGVPPSAEAAGSTAVKLSAVLPPEDAAILHAGIRPDMNMKTADPTINRAIDPVFAQAALRYLNRPDPTTRNY